jgi:hypothetical protein
MDAEAKDVSPGFEVLDGIEYSRKDGVPLLATIYRPLGRGPFPAAIGVHGGGRRRTPPTGRRAAPSPGATAGGAGAAWPCP